MIRAKWSCWQLALVKHAEKEMARRARLHTLLQLGYLLFKIRRPALARRQQRLDAEQLILQATHFILYFTHLLVA